MVCNESGNDAVASWRFLVEFEKSNVPATVEDLCGSQGFVEEFPDHEICFSKNIHAILIIVAFNFTFMQTTPTASNSGCRGSFRERARLIVD